MKYRLSTRVSGLFLGVLTLAITSSIVATVSAWRLQQRMSYILDQNLTSVQAAEELEIALLEQRGYVSAYILDKGNAKWLDDLAKEEPQFRYWLEEAKTAAHSFEEQQILARVEEAFHQYDTKRDQVVATYGDGRTEDATHALLKDVQDAYRQVYRECEQYIEANVSSAKAVTIQAQNQTRRMTVVVSLLLAMTVGLSAVLSLLFFRRILTPLRRILDEVDRFSGVERAEMADPPIDELAQVGRSLHGLMADVAQTRTSLEQSQELLVQSEKLVTVGRLAASVAHEIRNPLTAMKMWLFSIRRSVSKDDETVRRFDLISEEINRLEGIVQNFLEFSKPPAHAPKPVDVEALLRRTLDLMSYRIREKGVTASVQSQDGLPRAMADGEQIRQVLINLITNAAESMIVGGEVQITLSADRDEMGNLMVVVRVHDAGQGMSPEVRARIFEPFFTTRDNGTGLGLCIAAQIMVRHGGRLTLESTSSQGSCFAVWIPAADEARYAENPDR